MYFYLNCNRRGKYKTTSIILDTKIKYKSVNLCNVLINRFKSKLTISTSLYLLLFVFMQQCSNDKHLSVLKLYKIKYNIIIFYVLIS